MSTRLLVFFNAPKLSLPACKNHYCDLCGQTLTKEFPSAHRSVVWNLITAQGEFFQVWQLKTSWQVPSSRHSQGNYHTGQSHQVISQHCGWNSGDMVNPFGSLWGQWLWEDNQLLQDGHLDVLKLGVERDCEPLSFEMLLCCFIIFNETIDWCTNRTRPGCFK